MDRFGANTPPHPFFASLVPVLFEGVIHHNSLGTLGVRGVVVVPRHKSQAVGSSKVELGFPNIGGDDGDKIGAARSPNDKTPPSTDDETRQKPP